MLCLMGINLGSFTTERPEGLVLAVVVSEQGVCEMMP